MALIDVGLLFLRLVLGLTFFAHGAQKLFGWFGGHGMKGTTGMMTKMGVKPPELWALVTGLSEFLGGLGIAFGLLTPLAAALIVGVMIVAILRVHAPKGFFNTGGGIEFPLMNSAAATCIGFAGPGFYSLDHALSISYPIAQAFLAAVAVVILGVLISLLTGVEFARRQAQQK
jgi:putative oxidoreductase